MATTRSVEVQQIVEVTVDETKFDNVFMAEFRETMYPFYTIDRHIKHLAQLYARGIWDEFSGFIEGYGPPAGMGIKAKVTLTDTNMVDQ